MVQEEEPMDTVLPGILELSEQEDTTLSDAVEEEYGQSEDHHHRPIGSIEFKVPSELYGETVAVITDLARAIKMGYCPCGDGSDYLFTTHELEQLKRPLFSEDSFIPSSNLPYPLNLVALLSPRENYLFLPRHFQFDKKQYAAVKSVMERAGGSYHKNGFAFKDSGLTIYKRILEGEDYDLKTKFQAFFTPDELAAQVVDLAEIKAGDKVLEPSAGEGALVKAVNRIHPNMVVDCVELKDDSRAVLNGLLCVNLVGSDFMSFRSDPVYDKIVGNPPFSNNQDIDHISKMYSLLKNGGRLVSIASRHCLISKRSKEMRFMKWLASVGGRVIELERGAFRESGTNVSSVIILIDKH
jgi:predicted RNA methylase